MKKGGSFALVGLNSALWQGTDSSHGGWTSYCENCEQIQTPAGDPAQRGQAP